VLLATKKETLSHHG